MESTSSILSLALTVTAIAWVARRTIGDLAPSERPYTATAIDDGLRDRMLRAVLNNVSATELQHIFDSLQTVDARTDLANSVHADGRTRKTALFLACQNRAPGLAKVLLAARANVTAGRLDEGTTPLHLAAGWLHSSAVVEVLLAAPNRAGVVASLQAKPTGGGLRDATPVFWARHYGHLGTQRRLIAWMARNGPSGWHYDVEADVFTTKVWRQQAESPADTHAGKGSLSAHDAIAALAADGGNSVSLAELTTLLRLAGANPTEAEGAMHRKRLSDAGFEAVTASILEDVLAAHVAIHPPEEESREVWQAWDTIDEDGDDRVSGDEVSRLRTLLTTEGEPLDDDELATFLEDIDANGDGEISREEYQEMMFGGVGD